MKYKLTIAIIISILLLGGGIWETIYVEKTFSRFEDRLDIIMQQEQYDLDLVKETADEWNKCADRMEITIPHVQLTEITVTYGELVGAVQNEDFDSASALLKRIKEYTVRIGNLYGFNCRNVV